jgi:ABC-2 type transport system ATP-binding protein
VSSASVIEVEGLQKRYGGLTAVADVSFEVVSGEVFGLLGRNGAGKTTTVECLQGLRRPDAGRMRVLGLDPVNERGRLAQRIGCQLQDSSLPDRIRVREALHLFSAFAHRPADWRLLMEQWGLERKADAAFGSLSGGQRQRLLVALALVNQPELVFLDEMTTGLDPAARRVAWALVRAIRDRGTSVVLVTHFMDEAEELCDRVAIVDKGRVVAQGTPQGLIDGHAGPRRVLFSTDRSDLGFLSRISGVERVDRRAEQVEVTGTGPLLALTAAALVERGVVPADLRVVRPNLEDVFLSLTGGAP